MLTDATAGVSERYRARQLHLAKEEVQRCRATALADLAARLSAAQAELRDGDSRLPARKCDDSFARYSAVLAASRRVHALEEQIARLRAVAAGGDGPASPRTLCEVSLATPATLADPEEEAAAAAAQAALARQQQQQARTRRASGDEAAAAAAPYERLLEIRAALRAKAQLPAVRRGVPVASATAAAACRDALERRARWGGGGGGGGGCAAEAAAAAAARGARGEKDKDAALREAALRLPTGSGGSVGLWVSWTPELVSAAPGRFGGFAYEDEESIAGRLTSLRLREEGYALCVAGRAASGKTACVLRLAAGARLQAHFDGGVFVAPAERCTERLAGLMQRALGGGGGGGGSHGSDLSAATEAALLRVVRSLARGRRVLLVVDGFDAGCADAASAASLHGAGGAALRRLRRALAAHGPTGSKLVATVRVDGHAAGERGGVSRRRAEAAPAAAAAAVSMPNASVAGRSSGGEAGAALCLPTGVLDALVGGVFAEVHGMAWSSAMAVQLLKGVVAGGGAGGEGGESGGFPEPQLAALFEALRGSGAAAVLAAAAAREFAPLLSPEEVAQRLRREAEAQAARTLLRRTPPVERTAFELLVDAVVDVLPAAARALLPALAAVRGDGGGVPVAVLEGLFAEGVGGERKKEKACCASGLLVLHRLHFVTVFVGDDGGGGSGGGGEDLCFCVNPVVASHIRRTFADDATAFHARIAERLMAWRWGNSRGGGDGAAAAEAASEAMCRYVDMHVVEHLARGGVSGDDAVGKLLRVEVLQAYTAGGGGAATNGASRYLALLEQVARGGCRAACQLVAALKHGRHGGGDAGSFLTFFHSRLRGGEGRRLRALPAVAAFSKALSLCSVRAGADVLSAKPSEAEVEVGSDGGAFLWAKSLGCFCVAPSPTGAAAAPAGEGSVDVTRGADLRSVVPGAEGVASMCVTADRRRVLAVVRRSAAAIAADASTCGSLVVLRVQDMAVVEEFALPAEATCVAASPVAPTALVGDAAGGVTEWRTTRPLLRRSAAAAAVAACQAQRSVQACTDADATEAAVTFVAYAGGGGGDGVVCAVHASGRAAFLAKPAEVVGEAAVLCEGALGVKEPRVWPAAGRRLFLYGGSGSGSVVGGFFLKDGGLRVVPDLLAFGLDEDEDGSDGANAVVSVHVEDAAWAAGEDANGEEEEGCRRLRRQRGVAILASGRVEPFVLEEAADGGWCGTLGRDTEEQSGGGVRAGVAPAACGGCAAVQLASGGVVRVTPRSVELWGESGEAATAGSGGGSPRLLSEWPAEGCSAACALDGTSLLVTRGTEVWVVECQHSGVGAAPRCLRWCEWGGVTCAAAVVEGGEAEVSCAPRFFEAGASAMEVVSVAEAEERRARRDERRRRQEARGVGVGSGARLRVAAAGVVRASLTGPVADAGPSQQQNGAGGWRVALLEEASVLRVSWGEEEGDAGGARWQLQVQAGGRVEDYLLVDTSTGLTLLGVCAAGWLRFYALVVHRRRRHEEGYDSGVQHAAEEGGGGGGGGGGIPVYTGTRPA